MSESRGIGTMTFGEIEARMQTLVAQGIDCTQWAKSHGLASSSTCSVVPRKHSTYAAQLKEAETLMLQVEADRRAMLAAGQTHRPEEFNDGRTDKQRMKTSNMITNSGFVHGYGNGFGNVLGQQNYIPLYATAGSFLSPEPQVLIDGKQFVIVCNGRVEYAADKPKATEAAERLAHANQQDAFILAPISRTAPKRDVVTTPIKL